MNAGSDGLCETCTFANRIQSARLSVFILCRRSEADPAYPRYPRQPVLRCPGYLVRGSSPDKEYPPQASDE